MRRVLAVATMVVAMMTAGACGSDGGRPSDGADPPRSAAPTAKAIDGRTFDAREVVGREVVSGSTVTLAFQGTPEGSQLGASAGCNQMSAAYVIEASTLRWVGERVSTMMACEPDLMEQEAWLSELIAGGAEITVESNVLTLVAGGVTMILVDRAEEESPPRPLFGTVWALESVLDGATASTFASSLQAPTIEIAEGGAMQLFAGCNRGSTTVTLGPDGTSATIGPITRTKQLCPDGATFLEAAVLGVLEDEVSIAVEGDLLTVSRGDQGLRFRAT